MWETKKNKRPNVVMELEYKDFASLRVEKNNQGKIPSYTLFINIYSILNEQLVFYKLEDMSDILTYIKKSIEKFYAEYDEMSDEEYDNFIDEFLQKINEY